MDSPVLHLTDDQRQVLREANELNLAEAVADGPDWPPTVVRVDAALATWARRTALEAEERLPEYRRHLDEARAGGRVYRGLVGMATAEQSTARTRGWIDWHLDLINVCEALLAARSEDGDE